MIDPITALLNTPIPEKLWHYSSISGFQGIIESKSVFATDLQFLNDRREFIYTRKIAEDVAASMPEQGPLGFPKREFAMNAVNLTFETKFLDLKGIQIFVACFSHEEDQLSQWRGYSHGTSGVSLAFNLAELHPPAAIGTFVVFAPCEYDPSLQRELVESALKHSFDSMENRWNTVVKATAVKIAGASASQRAALEQEAALAASQDSEFAFELQKATNKTRMELLKIAALLKDPTFREEKEWRLVLPVLKEKTDLQNPRWFRPGRTTLIPYIKYSLLRKSDNKLPLVDLILGPGSDSNAGEAARSFLRDQHLDVTPRESKVPYRPSW
jgi:hypothetical protein